MCGIVGYITEEVRRGVTDRRKFFETALTVDQIRGPDSTGMFGVKAKAAENETADWLKIAADPVTLFQTKEYVERFGQYAKYEAMRAVVGHNRAATVGTVSNANAHPFQEGAITLVHNGTLDTTWQLGKSMHDLKKEGVEVDSHVICHNLAEAEDPVEVIKLLDGAFVLVWHDARDQSINIVRNEKRPLHMMWAQCEDTVLFASEGEMLFWIARRSNFADAKIVTPKPRELLKFLPGSLVPKVISVPQQPTRSSTAYRASGGRTDTTTNARHSSWTPSKSYNSVVQIIPETMRAQLDANAIDPLCTGRFVPSMVREVHGRGMAVVSGNYIHPDTGESLPAVIHGLYWNAVKDAAEKNEVWAMKPVGIKYLEDSDAFLVLGKLHARSYNSEEIKAERARAANTSSGRRALHRLGNRTAHEYLLGPHDEYIPAHAWLSATADGCCQCGCDIFADESDEVIWVQGRSRPLCPACQLDNEKWAAAESIN